MNILIVATEETEELLINLCQKSNYSDKIYSASTTPSNIIPNIEYKDLYDLAHKAKTLQIDIAVILDNTFIANNIIEIFRKNYINVFGINKKWLNLETSYIAFKKLIQHYSFNTPQNIKFPSKFPTVVKFDSQNLIVNNLKELVNIKNSSIGKNVFLEDFLEGEKLTLVSVWDGKNIFHFDINKPLNEVQQERLDLYKTKQLFMLSDEKANFIGFIISKLIWSKNDWYILNYKIKPSPEDFKNVIIPSKKDFIKILNSAIYQKLNEIK